MDSDHESPARNTRSKRNSRKAEEIGDQGSLTAKQKKAKNSKVKKNKEPAKKEKNREPAKKEKRKEPATKEKKAGPTPIQSPPPPKPTLDEDDEDDEELSLHEKLIGAACNGELSLWSLSRSTVLSSPIFCTDPLSCECQSKSPLSVSVRADWLRSTDASVLCRSSEQTDAIRLLTELKADVNFDNDYDMNPDNHVGPIVLTFSHSLCAMFKLSALSSHASRYVSNTVTLVHLSLLLCCLDLCVCTHTLSQSLCVSTINKLTIMSHAHVCYIVQIRTPVSWAAYHDHVDGIRLLVELKGDIHKARGEVICPCASALSYRMYWVLLSSLSLSLCSYSLPVHWYLHLIQPISFSLSTCWSQSPSPVRCSESILIHSSLYP